MFGCFEISTQVFGMQFYYAQTVFRLAHLPSACALTFTLCSVYALPVELAMALITQNHHGPMAVKPTPSVDQRFSGTERGMGLWLCL